MAEKKLIVEREPREYNGKTYYNYLVKGVIRGKEVKAALAPTDNGGFALLDIVYNDETCAELTTTPYEITDEKTKKTVKGVTYGVRNVDENGEIYECKVKPFRSSDRTLLEMLLKQTA